MTAEFDAHAAAYDRELAAGLALTGEDKDYYARARIGWIERTLRTLEFHTRVAVDFGCGDGTSTALLRIQLGAAEVRGVDVSEGLLAVARARHPSAGVRFGTPAELPPTGDADLVFVNGVFHHIPPGDRADTLADIRARLRAGGVLALWENNPWNPGTRFIMRRVPFDRNAILLTPPGARALVARAGFEILSTASLFYFPRALAWLRPIEPTLGRLPLGGQYVIVARRP